MFGIRCLLLKSATFGRVFSSIEGCCFGQFHEFSMQAYKRPFSQNGLDCTLSFGIFSLTQPLSMFNAARKQKYVVSLHCETPPKSLSSILYLVMDCVHCLPTSWKVSSMEGRNLSLPLIIPGAYNSA